MKAVRFSPDYVKMASAALPIQDYWNRYSELLTAGPGGKTGTRLESYWHVGQSFAVGDTGRLGLITNKFLVKTADAVDLVLRGDLKTGQDHKGATFIVYELTWDAGGSATRQVGDQAYFQATLKPRWLPDGSALVEILMAKLPADTWVQFTVQGQAGDRPAGVLTSKVVDARPQAADATPGEIVGSGIEAAKVVHNEATGRRPDFLVGLLMAVMDVLDGWIWSPSDTWVKVEPIDEGGNRG